MDSPSNEVVEILKLLKSQNLKIDRQYKLLNKLMEIIKYKTISDENILSEIKAELRKAAIFSNPELMKMNRANNLVISSENAPVYSQANVISYVERVSELGRLYSIDTGSLSVAANGFLSLQLTNPANSLKTMYINRFSGGASTITTIDMFKNATFAAAGTALTPTNSNWSFSDSSSMTAKYISQATDPIVGGTLITTLVQTGGAVALEFDGQLIIPSSTSARQLYIRLTNTTNQVNLLAVSIAWWEFPSTSSPG